ncbi:hypothetical protein VTK26DRAFT_3815 [Humicola hyalothermophila]
MSEEACEKLLSWARDRGIEVHGIEFRPIPGAGMGMIATKPLKRDERILYVPTSALRTIDTVRSRLKKSLPAGTKVHAMLAADLALDGPRSKYAPWNAVLPSREDLLTSMPLAWQDTRLHALLPQPAQRLLRAQQSKFARDWAAVQHALASSSSSSLPRLNAKARTVARADYLYAWLLANTRTFYHTTPRTARLPRDDRMVLQPVADLFNHTGSAASDGDGGGCEVSFTPGGFSVRAVRAYAPGEEVRICYGRHGNDFLLVEYGFVLPGAENEWDEAGLDEAVVPELTDAQRAVLEEKGFLGGYVLDGRTVCYRTLVAVRLMCAGSVEEWERLVDEGEDGGEAMQREVDRVLRGILEKYRGRIDGTIREVEGSEAGEACQRAMLATRWRQIRRLVEQAIERLQF